MDRSHHLSELSDVEASDLVGELVRGLEERGVPSGTWLVDIARVRRSLQDADALLRRLEDAIIRSPESSRLDLP